MRAFAMNNIVLFFRRQLLFDEFPDHRVMGCLIIAQVRHEVNRS